MTEQTHIQAVADWGLSLDTRNLPSRVVNELKTTFTKTNPAFIKTERLGFWTGNIERSIKAWSIDGPYLVLPRGARKLIEEVLAEFDLVLDVQDETVCPANAEPMNFKGTLRPHQESALESILAAGSGIVRGPCACGKTTILLASIAALNKKAIVIVHNGALFAQWKGAVADWLGFAPSTIGGGHKFSCDKPITIAMQQTLVRHADKQPDWADEFGVVAVDEVHHLASTTYQAVAKMFRAKYFLGVSADERRKDGLEFLTEWVLGPVIHEIKREELVLAKRLLPVEMLVLPTEYRDDLYLETIENDESPNWTSMLSRMMDVDNARAVARYELIKNVITKICENENARVLVLNDRLGGCHTLSTMLERVGLSVGLLIGSPENRKELDRTKAGLQSGRVRVGLGTTVADEGLDIPALTHVVLTCPVHSHPKRLEQMCGRAARVWAGKTKATAVYIWDKYMFPSTKPKRLTPEEWILNRLRLAVGDNARVVGFDEIE